MAIYCMNGRRIETVEKSQNAALNCEPAEDGRMII